MTLFSASYIINTNAGVAKSVYAKVLKTFGHNHGREGAIPSSGKSILRGMLMGLEKAIEHKKEHRKPYYDSRRICASCRNHGGCPYCENNRTFAFKKDEPVFDDCELDQIIADIIKN